MHRLPCMHACYTSRWHLITCNAVVGSLAMAGLVSVLAMVLNLHHRLYIYIYFFIYHYCANFASEDYAQKKKIQTHQFTVQSYNHLVCF